VGGCVAGGTGGGAEVWSIGDLFRRKCVDEMEWVGGARGAGWCSIPWSLVGEFHTVRLSASGLCLRAEILLEPSLWSTATARLIRICVGCDVKCGHSS
jgi:hypothetical protein